MKISLKLYLLIISVTISILSIVLIISLQVLNKDSNSSDVSVALNATDEFGYSSTIFIIKTSYTGQMGICGGSIIEPGIAVTAAHCVDGAKEIYIGTETLNTDDFSELIKVESTTTKDGWLSAYAESNWTIDNMQYDIAILKFDESLSLPVSTVETFMPGCGYEVVSYGTTLSEINDDFLDLGTPRGKQRISVCIENSSENLMFVIPESDTGLCFGDSGSPIYKTDSNKIVGIISSLINFDENGNICALNNLGLGVRLDSNYELISGQQYSGNKFYSDESAERFRNLANDLSIDNSSLPSDESTIQRTRSDRPVNSDFSNTVEIDANIFYGVAVISFIGILMLLVFGMFLLYKAFIEVSMLNEERLFNNQQYSQ